MMDDSDPIGGKLDIQFRPIAAKRHGMSKSRQRVLRAKPRPAPMRDVPDCHDYDANHPTKVAPPRA